MTTDNSSPTVAGAVSGTLAARAVAVHGNGATGMPATGFPVAPGARTTAGPRS